LLHRYRKQMEEMQKAFNKTIVKLQNTSRIAEEQDQRQTEAIQLLQAQLTNMTQLVSNLSTTVAELKHEVSDRQSYLVISLVLCVVLGLMLCMQRCRNTSQFDGDYISKLPKSNQYPSPKRCFSSYDDMSLKRRTSFPLIRSKSLQLTGKEVDPSDLYIVEPLKFSPEKKSTSQRHTASSLEKQIGKSNSRSIPLEWEDTYGIALVSGVKYKEGSLVINETGLYFVYSKVYFRGRSCTNQPLGHKVYSRNFRYPQDLVLMEGKMMNYCTTGKMWARSSYLGAVFNLTSADHLYVNVSELSLVSFEESKTFFGLYKL
ncbi:hypothetical protein G4228_010222, partial [Cervus hanglu yarkandensis]